jgi:transglutaminase-like putative cysteine protease
MTSITKTASVFDDNTLAFCLLLPVFMLFPDLPLWAFASSLIFWFYRLILDRSGWRIPSRLITGLFSIIFLGITYFSYKTLIGRDASGAFLAVLLGLKILEYRNASELGFLILLGIYLISSKFLYDTGLIWVSLGFPAIILLIYYLLPENFRRQNQKVAGITVIQTLLIAAPLGLFLFFYFPRFSNDMFNLHSNENRVGNIGFAEDVHPGSVSSLVQNEELAFRAEFKNATIMVNSLYWRGLVLTVSDGLRWDKDPELVPDRIVYSPISAEDPQVQITAEASFKTWLFSLDRTLGISSERITIESSHLGTFKATTTLDNRVIYNLRIRQAMTRPQAPQEKPITIKTPPDKELKQLLKEMTNKANTPEDYVAKISDYFVKNQFKYTLETGDNDHLTLSDFLFRTRKGFCEHFASSSALLLNYLGVPARVVIGYHGGKFNPVGKFWSIHQRDAHAWTEFLDSNQEWQRFDPTALVAPLRIALGAGRYEEAQNSLFDAEKLKLLANETFAGDLGDRLQYYFESLNYRWNFLFVNFDIDRQKELLRQMDINLGLAILLGMLFTLVLSLLLSWLFRVKQKSTRAQRILRLINGRLEAYGLEKQPTEAPLAWKERIIKALPGRFHEINILLSCYIAEAYEDKRSRENIKRARKIINSL